MPTSSDDTLRMLLLWNEESFHWLYSEYYKALAAFAYRMTGVDTAAEDIVQETMSALYEQRPAFTSLQQLRGFLFTTVRNRAVSYCRHQAVQRHYAPDEEESMTMDDDEMAFREELYRVLFRLIDSMPRGQRDVIVMHMAGMTTREIAEELGVGIETVKTQKKRAMCTLRDGLSGKQLSAFLIFFF